MLCAPACPPLEPLQSLEAELLLLPFFTFESSFITVIFLEFLKLLFFQSYSSTSILVESQEEEGLIYLVNLLLHLLVKIFYF